MIHADTGFVIDLLREARRGVVGPATRLLRELESDIVAVSVHVLCELHYGVELADNPARERQALEGVLASMDVACPGPDFARLYGRLDADLTRRGRRIPTMDLLIAAAALDEGATLVTRNVRHFGRVPDLAVRGY